jgi:hypothetical protein
MKFIFPMHIQRIAKHLLFLLIITVLTTILCAQPAEKLKLNELPRSGINVTWQNMAHLSTSAALTNAMKNSSNWLGNPNYSVDEHGYPTELEEGENASLYIYNGTRHYPTGDYTLKWDGSGKIKIETCSNGNFTFEPDDNNTQTVPVTRVCDGGIRLTILETSKGDHIRNIRFYLPGYDDNSSYWTDHYIDFHSQFGVTRFAWGSGMYSSYSTWDERSEPGDLNWSDSDQHPEINNGIPVEAKIDLANRAGVDLWICTPVRASRRYQRKLATIIRDQLDPGLKCWIEWGNEYWNCGKWGYEGCVYIKELTNQNDLNSAQNYAHEALDLFADFTGVFSSTGERNRLITVLGGQSGYSWELKNSTDEINSLGRMNEVDVFAIAPYFHGGEKVNKAYRSAGMDSVFNLLNKQVKRIYNGKGETGKAFKGNFDLARKYNKSMVAYEGGQHLTTWMGVMSGLPSKINRNEKMYKLYRSYLKEWESVGVTSTFVHYSDIASYNQDEAFGLKEYYDQPLSQTHKLRAFLKWLSVNR